MVFHRKIGKALIESLDGPCPILLSYPSVPILTEYDSHYTFIRMKELNFTSDEIGVAKRDFYRASKQRGEWLKDRLVSKKDLFEFDMFLDIGLMTFVSKVSGMVSKCQRGGDSLEKLYRHVINHANVGRGGVEALGSLISGSYLGCGKFGWAWHAVGDTDWGSLAHGKEAGLKLFTKIQRLSLQK